MSVTGKQKRQELDLKTRFEVIKVHLTSKYFFRLNKFLHLLERRWAFFKLNLDLLQAVKVTKSSDHLSHDRARRGMGLFPA